MHFLGSPAVMVIWVDFPERAASRKLANDAGQGWGSTSRSGTRCEHGLAVSARREDAAEIAVAA